MSRWRSYTADEKGMLTPEYADIFGVPFSGFPVAGLPGACAPATPKPGKAFRAVPEQLAAPPWRERSSSHRRRTRRSLLLPRRRGDFARRRVLRPLGPPLRRLVRLAPPVVQLHQPVQGVRQVIPGPTRCGLGMGLEPLIPGDQKWFGLGILLLLGEHGLRVHPRLDDLHRDGPLHRLGLLGHVHAAHAALADL